MPRREQCHRPVPLPRLSVTMCHVCPRLTRPHTRFLLQPPRAAQHRPGREGRHGHLPPGDGQKPPVCGSRRKQQRKRGPAECTGVRPGWVVVTMWGTAGDPGDGQRRAQQPACLIRDTAQAAAWARLGAAVCVLRVRACRSTWVCVCMRVRVWEEEQACPWSAWAAVCVRGQGFSQLVLQPGLSADAVWAPGSRSPRL